MRVSYWLVGAGPNAAAIPAQIRGLWSAKQRFGSDQVSWSRLLQPSIDMARNGIEVGFSLRSALVDKEEQIRADPGLK